MDPLPGSAAISEFGRFTLLPYRRELLADGQPIELGGRAFDVLLALIDAPGAVLTKDELMGRVWPGRVVEENSLQAQVSALRKALGADRDLIRTVAGRSYQFTGEMPMRGVHRAGEMHVEDERHATRFAEASVSEPNTSRVHDASARSGDCAGSLRFPLAVAQADTRSGRKRAGRPPLDRARSKPPRPDRIS